MKCSIHVSGEREKRIAAEFLESVGMSWLLEDRHCRNEKFLHVEFVDTPDALRTYSIQYNPMISNISSHGISFYFAVNPGDFKLQFVDGGIDGTLFCPMANVKSISTFGELSLPRNA